MWTQPLPGTFSTPYAAINNELNQENINQELEKTKEEIGKDLQKEMTDMFKKAFKGNKNIKFK